VAATDMNRGGIPPRASHHRVDGTRISALGKAGNALRHLRGGDDAPDRKHSKSPVGAGLCDENSACRNPGKPGNGHRSARSLVYGPAVAPAPRTAPLRVGDRENFAVDLPRKHPAPVATQMSPRPVPAHRLHPILGPIAC